MLIFSPPRTSLALGRGAGARLLITSVLVLASACSDDDPAPQTGAAGSTNLPDASVRDLPGDGQEETPDFDTDTRQRAPIGPDGLNEAIDDLQNGGNGGGGPVEAPDAAPPAVDADAG
jgi:hypothetical protein